ncbi:hypothetical protein [uncultured Psychroserpens sp.]|uniref:hypothetical protein n=1 Tax=uncultured Psychroserpens sp. TaxID=255436 RepID=UPI002626F82F|nr:hypothetical protein [uncultured Psychroserpens sp.]
MTTITSIKEDIIEVLRDEKTRTFQIDEQYLNEISLWPNGIKVKIKFDNTSQKYIITPINWIQNSVNSIKLY